MAAVMFNSACEVSISGSRTSAFVLKQSSLGSALAREGMVDSKASGTRKANRIGNPQKQIDASCATAVQGASVKPWAIRTSMRRPNSTPAYELENHMCCKDCSEVRGIGTSAAIWCHATEQAFGERSAVDVMAG
ncbi:hypothetical protein ACVWZ4_001379 [Bradyrhizobium sp. USDA 4472]